MHHIRGYEDDLDDNQVTEFVDRIASLSKDQTLKIERLKKQNETEINKIQTVLDGLLSERSAFLADKKSVTLQITANEKKLATLHDLVGKITMDEGGRSSLEANIQDLEAKVQKAKQVSSKASWEGKIAAIKSELRLLDDRSLILNQELVQGTKQAKASARLEHLRKEAEDRQKSLQTMTGAHGERLRAVVGPSWEPSTLEQEYQKALDVRKTSASEVGTRREELSRELQQLDFQLKTGRSNLKKMEVEVEKCAATIVECTQGEPEDYPESFVMIQSDRDTRRHDVDAFEILKKWYSECIDVARAEVPACRLCTRPFEKEKETRDFIRKCEKQLSKAALEAMQGELKVLEEELEKAKGAGSSYDTWIRLTQTEIPELKTEIQRTEQRREGLVRQIEESDRMFAEKEQERRDVETLAKPVANINRYQMELDNFQNQIQELAPGQHGSESFRSIDEVQEEIQLITSKNKDARASIDKLQAEESYSRSEINALELELGKAKTAMMTASHELEKKERTLTDIEDVKKFNRGQRETLARLDGQLEALIPRFAEEEAKQADLKHRAGLKEKDLEDEARLLRGTLQNLERSNHEIDEYIQSGGPLKLTSCQQEIQHLQDLIIQHQEDLRHTTVEINKINKELDNHGETKRVLKDNLKHRETCRELEAAAVEIDQLTAQNAESDQQEHRDEAEKWQRKHKLLTTEETSKMGAMKAKDDLLLQLLTDWNTDYKDAAAKFKKAHIEVETTKAAIDDLGRYGGALDQAIMKYHGLKMEEINRSIEELWKKTYQGTDVDTILIRSENESSKSNRSYNYRVSMVKQDVEMDMRGRCSAGQRVLACIIIRLALAECFGVNCGVLALDEPTTNLDADNIRALAESLHDIIRQRRLQSNFQLIVITHDEDFLRHMKCADFCDSYYRVFRNERQKSTIEKQSIADVL